MKANMYHNNGASSINQKSTDCGRWHYGQLAQLGRAVHEIVLVVCHGIFLMVSSCTGRGVQVPHGPRGFSSIIN